jgi:hypothetical protein
MKPLVLAVIVLSLLGCASHSLPYKPDVQPRGASISAGYQILADHLRVELDTDHRRLEDIWITKLDGSAVRAQTIDNAPTVVGPPPSVSVGVGGGSWGGRSGIGVGTGVESVFPSAAALRVSKDRRSPRFRWSRWGRRHGACTSSSPASSRRRS